MNPKRRSFFNPGALGAALLFCLMLPAQALTELDVLYRLARRVGLPPAALRVVNLGENALVLALAFGLAYLAALALWRTLERYTPAPPSQDAKTGLRRVLVYALICLLAWSFYLYAYWPGVMTTDSFDQWDQAHNLALLYDWHPVGHTLLIFLLTRLWDSPAAVMLAQTLAMALAWGWAMAFFERQGVTRALLLPLTLVFALLPSNGAMLVSLWKDIPYAAATLLLVFLLGRVALSRGRWLESRGHAALLGAALAAAALLRHNGLLVSGASLALLLAFYARPGRWRGALLAGVVAVAGVLLVQNGIAFGLLNAKPNDPAVSYVVPIQHIGAVIHSGASYTPEEQAVLKRIMPIDVWGKAYLRYSADSLSKPWGYQKDPQILEKIDQNRGDLLRVFLALAARNPRVVLASELDLTSMVWRILPPWNAEYRDYRYLFDLTSVERAGLSVPAAMQQANTPLKASLDQLLTTSSSDLIPDLFLWEGGLYLFLSLVFGLYGLAHHGRAFLLALAPSLANALSLALAMPGDNFRFVYPIVVPTALIALFAVLPSQGDDLDPHRV